MQTCPKCGFQQPTDQFCAQCGIDIETYHPEPKPLSSRLMASPFIKTFALAAILITAIFYVKGKFSSHRIESKTFVTLDGTPTAESAPQITSTRPRDQRNSLAQASKDRPDPQTGTEVAGVIDKSNESVKKKKFITSETPETDAAGTKTRAEGVSKWKVIFAEVPTGVYEDSLLPGGSGFRVGLVHSLDALVKSLQDIRELAKESHSIKKGEAWEVFKGLKNYEGEYQDVGLMLQVQVGEVSKTRITANISYEMRMPAPQERGLASWEPVSFSENLEIPLGSGLVIGGGLPRKVSEENNPLNGGPFKILTSQKYRAGETEFVIFVVPE